MGAPKPIFQIMTDNQLRRGSFNTRFGRMGAVVDENGTMVRFRFHAERRPDYGVEDDSAIAHIREQVDEYCAGQRRDFELRYTFSGGSNFERTIWEAMARREIRRDPSVLVEKER